ncbi:TetR/AcrR family transcriptional regulator [Naumannella cuiyingiana]|uniref:AcrR family transcriptional regulator n=1 Tax=Naumannella cuiyingiana TaxID=1347891 RepID=A0A7Z0D6I6_9ACTN|nr:TetR/AcrR family transcriptional regulator [Naumannella cuiyingiana]NYI69836.1 AcrR family transcriptional regulator [Naumannella cuiyingiana]
MADNRDRLVRTGAELIWQAGYSATSPRQVMAGSGVGQGSFYHHFPAKADLGVAAIGANAADIEAFAVDTLTGPEPGLTRIRRYLLAGRDALAGCKIGGLAYDPAVVADPRLLEPVGAAFRRIVALLADAIGDAQQAGAVREDLPAADLAGMVAAVVQGGFVLSRATCDPDVQRRAAAAAYALLAAAPAGR